MGRLSTHDTTKRGTVMTTSCVSTYFDVVICVTVVRIINELPSITIVTPILHTYQYRVTHPLGYEEVNLSIPIIEYYVLKLEKWIWIVRGNIICGSYLKPTICVSNIIGSAVWTSYSSNIDQYSNRFIPY